MFKTGIYNINQITTKNSNLKNIFGDDKDISITLYEQIQQLANADEVAERILLLFKDERGAYKRTYIKRFEQFDLMILEYLQNIFKSEEYLVIHDAGVSDGRTALDLFNKIAMIFPNCKYIASDYNAKVYIITKNKCQVTMSHTGKMLEIVWPPFVFNTIRLNRFILFYPINYLISFIVKLLVVSPMMKAYKAHKLQAKELMLFAPKVLYCAKHNPHFLLQQHDLSQAFKEQAKINMMRVMNVLNPSYFSKNELSIIINNIYAALTMDGLFITGSNQNPGSIVDGGIYQKTIKGFKQLAISGNGSPVATLIDQLIID